MKIRLADIKTFAAQRPEGYEEEVLSRGIIDGDALIIQSSAYNELVKKYNPTRLTQPAQCGTCGNNGGQLPNLLTQARNVAGAAKRVVNGAMKGERIKVDDAVSKERLAICVGCEFFNKEKERCAKCGCFMKFKTMLATEKCPVGKW